MAWWLRNAGNVSSSGGGFFLPAHAWTEEKAGSGRENGSQRVLSWVEGGSYTCPITVSFEDRFILVLPPLVATACIFLITVAVRR